MRKSKLRGLISALVSVALTVGISSIGAPAIAMPDSITLTTHYHRTVCDYGTGSADGWNLFLWKNVDAANGDVSVNQTPTSAFNFWEAQDDAFGRTLTTTVTGMTPFKDLGFIVRKGDWAAKDVSADRFISFDSSTKEIWLVEGDPVVYTTAPQVNNCGAAIIGATIDDFDKITVSTNRGLDTTYGVNGGFTLSGGIEISSLTVLAGTTTAATKIQLNLASDVTVGASYTVTHVGDTFAHSFGSAVTKSGGILDSAGFASRYTYTGNDLGATYFEDHADFRVWAPTATSMYLKTYLWANATRFNKRIPMTRDVDGTWIASLDGDNDGLIYMFQPTVNGNTIDVVDPYAESVTVNGLRSVLLDPSVTEPDVWVAKPAFSGNAVDATFYELHVRDLTMASTSGAYRDHKGKFLALNDWNTSYTKVTTTINSKTKKKTIVRTKVPTGMASIKNLGVSHVQLLPIYDFASGGDETSPSFNWGYDPQNYNAPEGQYATDPTNPWSRVEDLKLAVNGMHRNGLRVVMDVVYNHVSNADSFSMNQLVPGYFFRTNADGSYKNATGCGNEVASERPMVRKFIVDSVKHWASDYHLDGFRFDLMGILDVTTMNEIRTELTAIDPTILVIGEGWSMGAGIPEATQATQRTIAQLPGIGAFNDEMRDAAKGSVWSSDSPGYVNGDPWNNRASVKAGIVANTAYGVAATGRWLAAAPGQTVNYVEAHDNSTLADKLSASMSGSTLSQRTAASKMAASLFLLAQGMPFMHAGQEFMRSKGGDSNSYQSDDSVNAIRWDQQITYSSVRNYYKGLIALRKAHPAFRMTTTDAIKANLAFLTVPSASPAIAYSLNGTGAGDSWSKIVVVHNGGTAAVTITLPATGAWYVVVNGDKAGTATLATVSGNKVTVPARTTMVLRK